MRISNIISLEDQHRKHCFSSFTHHPPNTRVDQAIYLLIVLGVPSTTTCLELDMDLVSFHRYFHMTAYCFTTALLMKVTYRNSLTVRSYQTSSYLIARLHRFQVEMFIELIRVLFSVQRIDWLIVTYM